MNRLEQECEKAAASCVAPSYVLYLDLDGFKAVNDKFGHGAGDALLQAVAGRFRSHMRPCDTLGRLGGDEFAAILPAIPLHQVEAVALRLIESASKPFALEGLPAVHVGVSIGGARLTIPANVRRSLEIADTMLYEAKRAGKGILRLA